MPLERNGQTVELLQRKFHVTVPFAYSTAGYGVVFNMPGYGHVKVGSAGSGGMVWRADFGLDLDFWISAAPTSADSDAPGSAAAAIYSQLADATGHAPALREDAMIFWQSRNRCECGCVNERPDRRASENERERTRERGREET